MSVSPRGTGTALRASAGPSLPAGAARSHGKAIDGQDAVLGVEAKRQRVEVSAECLEKEEEVPPGDLEEFVDRMGCLGVERGSREWLRYWKEHAEHRLQFYNPDAYAEYMRQETAAAGSEEVPVVDDEGEIDESEFIDLEDGGEEARVMKMLRGRNNNQDGSICLPNRA